MSRGRLGISLKSSQRIQNKNCYWRRESSNHFRYESRGRQKTFPRTTKRIDDMFFLWKWRLNVLQLDLDITNSQILPWTSSKSILTSPLSHLHISTKATGVYKMDDGVKRTICTPKPMSSFIIDVTTLGGRWFCDNVRPSDDKCDDGGKKIFKIAWHH